MTICALETSGLVASAALLSDGAIVAEETLDGQLTHSQIALPMLECMLERAGVAIGAIDAFAVNCGPGSFTGLRIGICGVNAMAMAAGKPVVAVDSLAVLAGNLPFAGWVCSLIDARNDQVYAGLFDCTCGFPQAEGALFAGSIADWLRDLPEEGGIVFVGDGAKAQRAAIEAQLRERARFAPAHAMAHRAGTLAAIAESYARAGMVCEEAQPLYLRVPQAVRQKQQREADL